MSMEQNQLTRDLYAAGYYGMPIPAYKKGYRLFANSHLPEKITVFGVGQRNQDIYNADELDRLLGKTVITRTFEEVTGKDIRRIHQMPIPFLPEEREVYNIVLKEFYRIQREYYSSTGNSRKDALMRLIQQITLLLRISAAPDCMKEYEGETPLKEMAVVEALARWPEEVVAIGVRHTTVLDRYAAAIREYLPERPLFVVTGSTVTFAKRRALREVLRDSRNGILLCTQQSLPSSVNFEFVNKIIIPEMHYNNAGMSQFYMRFVRYTSTEKKDLYFPIYIGSLESNLMQMVLAKEKLTMFRRYIAMLIAVDHGNKQIKTVHTPPFTSGLIQSDTPGFGTDALAYRGKYYTLTDQRIPYRRDKTEDERFFILTLFAIAHEIEAMEQYSGSLMRVQLAVGLPPAHFGVQAKRFINYFNGRGAVAFQFKGKTYAIFIENTACFPQSFSAAAATVKNLASFPRALVVDIGGFTADYVRLRNGVPDMAACDSLENGVILLYNRICAKANAELDILLEESEIDRILRGEDQDAAPEVIALTEREAQEFINDLLSGLRERMLELKSGKVIFLGGGATLLRRQIEASGKIGQAIFVEDINANAKGYEYLYRLQHSGR